MFAGKPLLLMILDGWGMPEHGPADALDLAKTPVYDRLWSTYPHTSLGASGLDVGLPEGQMGDSEVGHMNIGAGRVVYQDFTHINREIAEGSFFHNQAFVSAFTNAKAPGRALHIIGLVSDGGIHSHIDHLFELIRTAKQHQVEELYIHCFTDGRDTNNEAALEYILPLEDLLTNLSLGKIATVIGRFYAMDRDKRWNRVQLAYDAMVYGLGEQAQSAKQAVCHSYAQGDTDEFIKPHVITGENGHPVGLIKNGDSVIFFNYRSDRARELSHAFTDKTFDFFDRGIDRPKTLFVTLTAYDDTLFNTEVAYPPHPPFNTLGRVLSRNGLNQLRIAETEKYAHVTFFFNGGMEKVEVREDRVMIPSPNVKTYDLQPEMNALLVTSTVVDRVKNKMYDVIILNFANPDMLGHTGNIEATVNSLEFIDDCLGKVQAAMEETGGTLIITADHGNVERMIDADGLPMTSHTTNRVPFILVDEDLRQVELREGKLEDVAPTMLHLLGLKQPDEMTGKSLIVSGLRYIEQPTLF
ncbi:MAG: 2,3-bisphosphoglycerate-independent phosphoglycerate mutase [Firmicutes bacterium]|nr:2,3-bisphosphoglycerate-independent phosphoglycerate mutase [Bacillota bacterium]